MMPPLLEQLEKKLRAAARCRRYPEVTRLTAEFGEAVRAYAQSLPKSDPRVEEAARKLDDVLSWALVMLYAARSSCLAELRRVTAANRYSRRYSEQSSVAGVRLDA
jgi:NTP pyrophosphatase (non-canonical NTP hydrolase)